MGIINTLYRVTCVSLLSCALQEGEFNRETCDCLVKESVSEAVDQVTVHFRGGNQADPYHDDFGKTDPTCSL